MIQLSEIKKVFFLGIGGIGMSALARYLSNSGVHISGYDRERTPLTKKLEAEGINIVYSDNLDVDIESIDVVIYTPAISKDQEVYQYFESRGSLLIKRSEALEEMLKQKKVIAIAGTHGKTSTSALLAHIAEENGLEITAFVGGVMSDYDTNFFYGSGDWVIIEADEYDRSFWRLYPDIAIINAMDADHLDIYDTHGEMIDAYKVFSLQISSGGALYVSDLAAKYIDDSWERELNDKRISITSFGLHDADVKATHVKVNDGQYQFEVDETVFKISQPGYHNIYNSLGALSIARDLGLRDKDTSNAFNSFKGIERRFEYRFNDDKTIIIDDYAHHPVEVEKTIEAVRMLYPNRKLTAVFQPHLYSRTQDFKEEFAKALDQADETILVELYPAREVPVEGVSSESILELMQSKEKVYIMKNELEKHLAEPRRDIILFMGAGDANRYIDQIIVEYSR